MRSKRRGYADKRHEVLRYLLDAQATRGQGPYSDRKIAGIACVSKTTVKRLRDVAAKKKVTWQDVVAMGETERNQVFNKPSYVGPRKRYPDMAYIHAEMQRPNVTAQLLWEEYVKEGAGDALSYTQFAELYRRHRKALFPSMRRHHEPGAVVEVDYAGGGVCYQDAHGQPVKLELFVAALPHSSLAYVLAAPTQSVSDFIDMHVQMFAFFGGVVCAIVPDNLKAAVDKPGSHPYYNRGFRDFCRHYDVEPRAARVRKPKDKATVECTVKLVKTRILARLRHRAFHSKDELNQALAEMLTELNDRPMTKDGRSRHDHFNDGERQALRPLPERPYLYREFVELPPVRDDYCVTLHGHVYSVPDTLIGKTVDARLSNTTVEILFERRVVASHPRSYVRGGQTINLDHMPPSHRAQAERNPMGMLAWAQREGGALHAFVAHLFATASQPYKALTIAEDVKRLVHSHGVEHVQHACQRAMDIQSPTISSLRRFLHNGLARAKLSPSSQSRKRTARSTPVTDDAERNPQDPPRLWSRHHGHLP